jgi:hypothetical protein
MAAKTEAAKVAADEARKQAEAKAKVEQEAADKKRLKELAAKYPNEVPKP